MALKSVYKSTRGDKKQFLKDISPGDRLYVVQDNTGANAITDPKVYSEYIVLKERALDFTGTPMVCSPDSRTGRGEISAVGLLHRYREVYSAPPAGATNLADLRQGATNRQVGAYATRVFEAALAEDRRNSRQPVAAGKKRGWF